LTVLAARRVTMLRRPRKCCKSVKPVKLDNRDSIVGQFATFYLSVLEAARTRFSCFLRMLLMCLQVLAELLDFFADFVGVLHCGFGSVYQAAYTVRVGKSEWLHQVAKSSYGQPSRQPSRLFA